MESEARRFIAVVVVVLVLLAGLMGALLSMVDTGGPVGNGDHGEGWHTEEGLIVVDGDATWSKWQRTMDMPVLVTHDGSLLIEDSVIEVPVEDLVFERNASFTVEPGCSLELSSTFIRVDYDEELDDAWVCDWYGYGQVPLIWRAVDLRGTVAPHLELDVEIWHEAARVGVAVQQTPQDELEILAVAGSEEVGLREWHNLKVSLVDYIGGTPRVVVFVAYDTYYSALVSGLTVKDQGLPLPGDVLGTGDLVSEGWNTTGFRRFTYMLSSTYRTMEPLVLSEEADVSFVRSQVSSVPGLGRTYGEYRPHLLAVDEHEASALLPATSLGGEVNVSAGTLTVLDANVSCVPFVASKCGVDVRGSGFTGDNEMLTLHSCSGAVEGCYFTYEAGTVDRGLASGDEALWQLGVEEVTGEEELIIDGCRFRGRGAEAGTGFGLHLNNADLLPAKCSFDGLELAIWKHGGDRQMTWEMFGADLTMGEDCGQWYVDTEEVLLRYDGLDRPSEGRWGQWIPSNLVDPPPTPMHPEMFERGVSLLMCVPSVIVDPVAGVEIVDELTVHAYPGWASDSYVTFDPKSSELLAWFEALEYSPHWAYVRPYHGPGNVTGTVLQTLEIYIWNDYYQDERLEVLIDGRPAGERELNFTSTGYGEKEAHPILEHVIGPGLHTVSLVLSAMFTLEMQRMELTNLTVMFLRLDGPQPRAAWSSLAEGDMGVLMVDPGVEVEDVRLEGGKLDDYSFQVGIVTWEGSRVVLESVSSRAMELAMDLNGSGEVVLRDVETDYYSIVVNRTNLTCLGTFSGRGGIYGQGTDVHIYSDYNVDHFYLYLADGSLLDMEGADVEFGSTFDVNLEDSEAVINDCSFRSASGPAMVYVSLNGDSAAIVVHCIFSGTALRVLKDGVNLLLEVLACTFTGRGSYLLLLGNLWYYPWERDYEPLQLPAAGEVASNSFSGEGSGIIFDPLALDGFLGSNEFTDGAQALAFYAPNVTFDNGTGDGSNYVAVALEVMRWGARSRFIRDTYDEWFRYLVDVTDDLSVALDPGPVSVVVRDSGYFGNHLGTVVAFMQLPAVSGRVVLRITPWPSLEIDISGLSGHVSDGWWSGD